MVVECNTSLWDQQRKRLTNSTLCSWFIIFQAFYIPTKEILVYISVLHTYTDIFFFDDVSGINRRRKERNGQRNHGLLSWLRARSIILRMDTDGENTDRRQSRIALTQGFTSIITSHSTIFLVKDLLILTKNWKKFTSILL